MRHPVTLILVQICIKDINTKPHKLFYFAVQVLHFNFFCEFTDFQKATFSHRIINHKSNNTICEIISHNNNNHLPLNADHRRFLNKRKRR